MKSLRHRTQIRARMFESVIGVESSGSSFLRRSKNSRIAASMSFADFILLAGRIAVLCSTRLLLPLSSFAIGGNSQNNASAAARIISRPASAKGGKATCTSRQLFGPCWTLDCMCAAIAINLQSKLASSSSCSRSSSSSSLGFVFSAYFSSSSSSPSLSSSSFSPSSASSSLFSPPLRSLPLPSSSQLSVFLQRKSPPAHLLFLPWSHFVVTACALEHLVALVALSMITARQYSHAATVLCS